MAEPFVAGESPAFQAAMPALEVRHCPSCGTVKRSYWTKAEGRTVARYKCDPCFAAYRRAANKARDPATLSAQSLTKMGMGHLIPPKPWDKTDEAAASKREAKAAWTEWIKVRAPDWWMARYHTAKPWSNPRLSDAEQYRLRYANDAAFLAQERVRLRLKKVSRRDEVTAAIRMAALGQRRSLWSFLGYTPEQLRAHLIRTLPKRTAWSDFISGRLHIDHIVPIKSFDLSRPEELAACFALSNLRLLDPGENRAKWSHRLSLV